MSKFGKQRNDSKRQILEIAENCGADTDGTGEVDERELQTFMKIQQAPLPVHSSLLVPTKFASKNTQFKNPGILFIRIKITNNVSIELNQLELMFLFSKSNVLFPLYSILIK